MTVYVKIIIPVLKHPCFMWVSQLTCNYFGTKQEESGVIGSRKKKGVVFVLEHGGLIISKL